MLLNRDGHGQGVQLREDNPDQLAQLADQAQEWAVEELWTKDDQLRGPSVRTTRTSTLWRRPSSQAQRSDPVRRLPKPLHRLGDCPANWGTGNDCALAQVEDYQMQPFTIKIMITGWAVSDTGAGIEVLQAERSVNHSRWRSIRLVHGRQWQHSLGYQIRDIRAPSRRVDERVDAPAKRAIHGGLHVSSSRTTRASRLGATSV
jgi:hypothetical protein